MVKLGSNRANMLVVNSSARFEQHMGVYLNGAIDGSEYHSVFFLLVIWASNSKTKKPNIYGVNSRLLHFFWKNLKRKTSFFIQWYFDRKLYIWAKQKFSRKIAFFAFQITKRLKILLELTTLRRQIIRETNFRGFREFWPNSRN